MKETLWVYKPLLDLQVGSAVFRLDVRSYSKRVTSQVYIISGIMVQKKKTVDRPTETQTHIILYLNYSTNCTVKMLDMIKYRL